MMHYVNITDHVNHDSALFCIPHHFTCLLGEVEGVWKDVYVGRPLQLVSTVGGDVELYVVPFQKGHLGFGVLFPKWQFLVTETDPGTDATWKRVILWVQKVGE